MNKLSVLDQRLQVLLDQIAGAEQTPAGSREDLRHLLMNFLITDALTECHNRQFLEEALQRFMQSTSERRALLSMDIDHFKQINDLYGHHIGDQALQNLAQGILKELGPEDALIRLGGDEFLLVLSDAGVRGARSWAESLRSRVRHWIELPDGGALQVSISIGVLIPDPEEPVTPDQLLERVDHALYTSKRMGRDRCTVWTSHLPKGIELPAREDSVADPRTMQIQRDQAREFSIDLMSRILEAREYDTGLHSERVTRVTAFLVERLEIPMAQRAGILQGARLHDVGKIAVPDKILHKQDRLNDYEQHIMRKHPEVGFRFVTGASFLSEAAKVILHHHECWDGSGYPHGLSGEQIPIGARIFTVVDAYDSMRANRVYRASMTPAQAESELRDKAGSQFDPHVVEVFLQHLDEIEDIGHWQGIEGE